LAEDDIPLVSSVKLGNSQKLENNERESRNFSVGDTDHKRFSTEKENEMDNQKG
jgi:hypothetical protein